MSMWDALVRPFRDHLPLWLMLMPLLGIVSVRFASRAGAAAVQRAMLVNFSLSAALCFWLVVSYEPLKPAVSQEQVERLGPLQRFQFRDSFAWVGESRVEFLESVNRRGERRIVEVPISWGPDIRFAVGVDGLSIWFVALSVLLVAVAAIGDFTRPTSALRVPSSPTAWFWLQASMVGTFVALDVVLFVGCWMSTLLAVAWLIGTGGDSWRHQVIPQLLKISWLGGWLVTLGLGSLVLAFGWLRESPNSSETPLIFSIPELLHGIGQWTAAGENAYLWGAIDAWPFWLLVVGFTAPMGLAPLHHRFVDAFASAPRGAAIVMAGLLLKIGVYGWLRFIVPLFPDLLSQHANNFAILASLSSLFAAALAFEERDWNRRIALATCSSVGLCLTGVMTMTVEGLTGGVLRVLSHGVTAGLLVWLLPRQMNLLDCVPLSADSVIAGKANASIRNALVRFALYAWIGMPGLSGFVAEFVTPFGLFPYDLNVATLSLATSGLVAWMWVRADRDSLDWLTECWTRRDTFVAGTLVVLNVALGVVPQFVVNRLQPSVIYLSPIDRESLTIFSPSSPNSETH